MTDLVIDKVLMTIFRKVFRSSDLVLTPQLNVKDLPDWDSFRHVEIIIAAEEHFGIRFRTAEIDSIKNVGDLAQLIAAKT